MHVARGSASIGSRITKLKPDVARIPVDTSLVVALFKYQLL